MLIDVTDTCLNRPNCSPGPAPWAKLPNGIVVCGQCRRPNADYMKGMMRMTERKGRPVCGFCQTGHHDNCAYAIVNGDGSIVFCGCQAEPAGEEHHHVPACALCRRRQVAYTSITGKPIAQADIDASTGKCVDLEDCDLFREARRQDAVEIFAPAREKAAERSGQAPKAAVRSSQTTTTTTPKGSTTRRSDDMSNNESNFRVKAGGGKGTAVLEAVKDSKNHGLSRSQLAEKVGCTVGRVGEVIRYELAEGTAADKKAVQAFLDAVPSRKATATEKPQAKKAPAKAPAKKAAAKKTTAKAPAKPRAKKATTA